MEKFEFTSTLATIIATVAVSGLAFLFIVTHSAVPALMAQRLLSAPAIRDGILSPLQLAYA